MEVDDLIDSQIMQILTFDVAKELVGNLMGFDERTGRTRAGSFSTSACRSSAAAGSFYADGSRSASRVCAAAGRASGCAECACTTGSVYPLQPQSLPAGAEGNFGLIMDVPMQVTVELGRTKKLIRDILELAPGSVVELDKLAGEPVDIFVNTKLIARGEVVVIDENFGVRVTEIVSPVDRLKTLQ